MGIELSAEDKELLSADELAALSGAGAEKALATMGDNQLEDDDADDDGEGDTADAAAAGDKPAEDAAADATKAYTAADGEDDERPTPEELKAVVDEAAPAAPQAPKQYNVPEATELEAKLADIRKRTAELNKAWAEGEKSDEDYSTEQEQLLAERDSVNRQMAKAEALREINEQNAAELKAKRDAEIDAGIAEVLKASAKPGSVLDYAKDTAASAEFDAFLSTLERMPAHAAKTGQQLAMLAHQQVLLARGLPVVQASQQTTPARVPGKTAAKPAEVPVTLSGLPNAAVPAIDDDIGGQLASMDAMEVEDWLAQQSENTQRRVLKRADATVAQKH